MKRVFGILALVITLGSLGCSTKVNCLDGTKWGEGGQVMLEFKDGTIVQTFSRYECGEKGAVYMLANSGGMKMPFSTVKGKTMVLGNGTEIHKIK